MMPFGKLYETIDTQTELERMPNNSEIILAQILEARRAEAAPDMPNDEFFEIFCAEQATKEFELSYEEIEGGIVDGEHDGGIDAFYTFLNGEHLDEETEVIVPKKNAAIEVIVVQSKSNSGFSETPINNLISSLTHLLSLSQDYSTLTQYNRVVKARTDIFRNAYTRVVARFPEVLIRVIFASPRTTDNIHPNTRLKAEELVSRIRSLFDGAVVKFDFLGARELASLARQRPSQTFDLKFTQVLNGENGYVSLVRLADYYSFLCGGGQEVRSDLFDANVRDYQGSTEVNQEIAQTLQGNSSDDFWWFNNGVTILASKATSANSRITIENPQIVNGLQTSSELARYFSEDPPHDDRAIMVKIVASEDEEIRDKIIKATNSQNQVPPASLRATDKVQRDIEHHLKANGLFYDRRKNFYKNEGKPAAKIISIGLLAQAVMTLFRGEPDNARARPSSLIKEDYVYNSIFSESFELDAYFVAAETIRRVELALKKTAGIATRDRNNLRFYVLYWACALTAKSLALSARKVSDIKGLVTYAMIESSISEVKAIFDQQGGTDQIARVRTH